MKRNLLNNLYKIIKIDRLTSCQVLEEIGGRTQLLIRRSWKLEPRGPSIVFGEHIIIFCPL